MSDSAKFWNKRADRYSKSPVKDTASYEKTLTRVREHLSASHEILEVGCGTGSTALALAPAAKQITATDISSRMIEIAREKAAAQGVENVRFERAALSDEIPGQGHFDVVMGFNFLHLLEDKRGAVLRIRELLKPGGLFISKTTCLAEQSRLWALLLVPMRMLGFAPYVGLLKIAEFEAVITDAGFEILETGDYPPSPPGHFVVARKT